VPDPNLLEPSTVDPLRQELENKLGESTPPNHITSLYNLLNAAEQLYRCGYLLKACDLTETNPELREPLAVGLRRLEAGFAAERPLFLQDAATPLLRPFNWPYRVAQQQRLQQTLDRLADAPLTGGLDELAQVGGLFLIRGDCRHSLAALAGPRLQLSQNLGEIGFRELWLGGGQCHGALWAAGCGARRMAIHNATLLSVFSLYLLIEGWLTGASETRLTALVLSYNLLPGNDLIELLERWAKLHPTRVLTLEPKSPTSKWTPQFKLSKNLANIAYWDQRWFTGHTIERLDGTATLDFTWPVYWLPARHYAAALDLFLRLRRAETAPQRTAIFLTETHIEMEAVWRDLSGPLCQDQLRVGLHVAVCQEPMRALYRVVAGSTDTNLFTLQSLLLDAEPEGNNFAAEELTQAECMPIDQLTFTGMQTVLFYSSHVIPHARLSQLCSLAQSTVILIASEENMRLLC